MKFATAICALSMGLFVASACAQGDSIDRGGTGGADEGGAGGATSGGANVGGVGTTGAGTGGISMTTGTTGGAGTTGATTGTTGATTGATTGGCTPMNLVVDGGLELGPGSGSWTESSTQFGTPICDGSCSTTLGPSAGAFWAWFGGTAGIEISSIQQSLVIPTGATTLDFMFSIPSCDTIAGDTFEVKIDGQVVFGATNTDAACGSTAYTLRSANIANFADGLTHTLEFRGVTDPIFQLTSFFLDEISLVGCQ